MTDSEQFAAWAFADTDDIFAVGAFVGPVDFAAGLSFDHDVSARQSRLDLDLTPYLRKVLEACDFIGRGNVCLLYTSDAADE